MLVVMGRVLTAGAIIALTEVLFNHSGGGCNGCRGVPVQVLDLRCPGVMVVVVSVSRCW